MHIVFARDTTLQRSNLPGKILYPVKAEEAYDISAWRREEGFLIFTLKQATLGGYNTWHVPQAHARLEQRCNAAGVKLIKEFEGLELKAYRCSAGVWSVGFGTTQGVTQGMVITAAQAEEFLQRDLRKVEAEIRTSVSVSLTDGQFSSLCSFVYNIGGGAFWDSTLRRKLNQGDYAGAAREFKRWNLAGGKVLEGLTRRRTAEAKLFLS